MIYLAVATLSAAILAYEVLLMRLLAIVQWHHFAYMVISIALLGFGASGTFLALAQDWLKPRFVLAFAANAALFGILALVVFALGERVPFNALEVIWNPKQLLYLALSALHDAFLLRRQLHRVSLGLLQPSDWPGLLLEPDRFGRWRPRRCRSAIPFLAFRDSSVGRRLGTGCCGARVFRG